MTDWIMIIDLLAAKIAMLAFITVAAKFVIKPIGAKSADRFLMKIHRPAGYTLAVAGLIHMILSFRMFAPPPVIVYVLGIICVLAILVSIAAFIFGIASYVK